MAEIFTDIAQFKAQIGGAINTSIDMRSIEPVIADAARTHIVPYLGATYYNELVTAAAGTPNAAQNAVLAYLRKALAKITMYEYMKVANVQFGEMGLHRVETENRKSAYRYQERDYSNYMVTNGYNDIESMLRFLSDNYTTYTTWANSEEGLEHRSSVLAYAAHVRLYVQSGCDRWSYETLRPLIKGATEYGIKRLMPAQLYNSIVTKIRTNALNSDDKILVGLLRTAIANMAIAKGIKENWIKLERGNVVVIELFGEQSSENRTSPSATLSSIYWQSEMNAQQYNRLWIEQIERNPTLYPLAYDVASGGTNTDADAWHINTAAEAEAIAAQKELTKGGIVRF